MIYPIVNILRKSQAIILNPYVLCSYITTLVVLTGFLGFAPFTDCHVHAAVIDQRTTGKSIINVKDAGAVGNGVSDDTTAVLKALASITPTNNTIYFPEGTYKITKSVRLPSNVRLQGSGPGSRLVMGKSLRNGIFSALDQSNITISGLSFEGTGVELKKNTTERLLFFNKCSLVKINDCEAVNTIIAFQGQSCVGMSVTSCYVHDIKHRIDYSQGYGLLFNLSCNDIVVSKNRFYKIGRHAIYVSSGTSNTKITDNVVDGCESSAISVYSKSHQAVVDNILIARNDIKNVSGRVSPRGISIAVWCKNLTVRNNKIFNVQQYGIAVEGGADEEMHHNPSNITIEENIIQKCSSAGVWVVNASSVTVKKNLIDAKSGIIASTAGKLQGSYLKSFSALDNTITYQKYGILLAEKSKGVELEVRGNIFKTDLARTRDIVHVNK
ncbi:MAG TPA: hypothetical protein DDY22_08710 [Geobacter sp.]|nr:hypothetical protein [Geobacter sp.]